MSYIVGSSQQLISSQVLSGTSTTITFSSIPQNFNHLRLVVMARSDGAANNINMKCTLNSDSGSNYDYQYIAANNNVLSGSAAAASTLGFMGTIPAASASASYTGLAEVIFYCYKNTTFYKTFVTKSSFNTASTGNTQYADISTTWRNTAAITTIVITGSGNFVVGSSFYLYGVN